MSNRTARAAISTLLAAVATVLLLPGSALAVLPTTAITSPTNDTYLLVEEGSTLLVKGTASFTTEVDIRCYLGNEEGASFNLASGVKVAGGAFEAAVPETELVRRPELCQLRAVPHGSKEKDLGPGQESAQALHYTGPVIAASSLDAEASHIRATSTTLAGSLFVESSGRYSFESSLYSTVEHETETSFYGDGQLRAYPPALATRTAIEVDGSSAYTPEGAQEVRNNLKTAVTGAPSLTVPVHTWNEATHQFTTVVEEPLVRCAPSDVYPPTTTSCTSFVSAGVKLVRGWQASHESRLATMTQAWQSTDGAAHSVNVRMYNEMHSGTEAAPSGGVYQFPGEAAFGLTKTGETKTLPGGPGIILYKTSAAVPAAGDGAHPQDAIAYDQAPSGPVEITMGSNENAKENTFEAPLQASVPAGGSSTVLRMAFAQSFSLGEAQALAEEALASYYPTVAITAPANGSSIVSLNPTVTVTGTAGDQIGLTSFTVDGKAVAVGAGGAWSTPVTLTPGANTITAVATDQSGLSRTAAVTVDYAVPPAAIARLSGKASGKNGKITLTLICSGLAGQSCKIAVNASTLEHLLHGRLRSISARNKRVGVAATTLTLAAGQRITISLGLNKTGRKLLQRFGRLPVTLKATLVPASGKPTTLLNTTITVKPKPKPKPKHHH